MGTETHMMLTRVHGSAVAAAPDRSRRRRALLAITTSLALALPPVLQTPAAAFAEPIETAAVVAPAEASLTGNLIAGATMSVETGTWTPSDASLEYEWWKSPQPYAAPVDGEDLNDQAAVIEGAHTAELVLDSSLAGHYIWAVVTGTAPELAPASIVAASAAAVELPSIPGLPDVSITGNAVVGAPVSATLSAPVPDGVTADYQWRRDGTPILEESDAQSYTAVAADALTTLDVVVTFTAEGLRTESRTSAGIMVAKATFMDAPAATLSGAVRVESPVTAVTGAWPEGTSFTYSWRFVDAKGVETVSRSTSQVYSPTASTVGRKLSVIITGTVPGHLPVSKRSGSVTIARGAFTSAPTPKISGSAYVGATLKATAGTWAPTASLRYQWKRNGVSIAGATASSYRLTSSDFGKKLTVTVVGSRTAYTTTTRTSGSTATVAKPFTTATAPKISGTARGGMTLTAIPGAWSPTPTLSYQWNRNGVAVAGKTASTYRLTSADVGTKITVTVTYRRSGYFTRTVTSAATAAVTPATSITRDGGFQVGLHVAPGTYYATGGDDCWFERRSDSNFGQADGLLGYSYNWEYYFGGQKVVKISSSDAYFYTEGCGTWRQVISAPRTTLTDGTYVVGSQMKRGSWKVVGPFAADGCKVEFLNSFTGDPEVDIAEWGYIDDVNAWIWLDSATRGFTTDGCGKWVWVP